MMPFAEILARAAKRTGGPRQLADCPEVQSESGEV